MGPSNLPQVELGASRPNNKWIW